MFLDQVVLVTGAASGIGLETSRQFLKNGARVVGVDYDAQTLEKAVTGLGDRFFAKRCDVCVENDIVSLRGYVEDSFGRLDVLVNNAGRARFLGPEDMAEDDFYYHYDVLVKGPMLLVKHFARLLKGSSNPCVINISSLAARMVSNNHFLYSTAKAAVEKFTYHLVRDLPGIRSNAILPGFIETPIFSKSFSEEQLKAVAEGVLPLIPCKRIGQPEDIANCILFLCSEKASYINGASIVIDGGYVNNANWGI